MKPVTILKRARKLLSKPERWTKGELARSKSGEACSPSDRQAVCFCAEGALQKYSSPSHLHYSAFNEAFAALNDATPRGQIPPYYNDHPRRAHAQILKWFDRAISRLEASK